MKRFFKDLWRKKLQTRSSLKWSLFWRICKGKSFKPASALNEAFLKGSVKQDASNQLQPQMKPFLKDLWSKMLQTRSSLKWRLSLRICKGKSSKPDPASNEAFLKGSGKQGASNQIQFQTKPFKGSVKQDASNQLQLQMKPFLKDL